MDSRGSEPAADSEPAAPGPPRDDVLPASASTAVKIVIVGGFGVGKTTMAGAVSEIRPLTTEETMTEAGVGSSPSTSSAPPSIRPRRGARPSTCRHMCRWSSAATALHGPEARRDPAGIYPRSRAAHSPVAPIELEGGAAARLVLGYRENMEAARTPNRFTRDARIWREWRQGRIPMDSPLVAILGRRPDCTSQDGVEHQRLRSAVNDCVARVDRHGVRRHIQHYANQLIDAFGKRGRADLVAQEEDARLLEACAGRSRAARRRSSTTTTSSTR